MELPIGINGPKISEGDLVSFTFSRAILHLRLPQIPYNHDTRNIITSTKDWSDLKTKSWESYVGGKCVELVNQSWKYENQVDHDDAALCHLHIDLVQFESHDDRNACYFNDSILRQTILYEIGLDCARYPTEPREGWPCVANDHFIEAIDKPQLNGFVMQADLDGGQVSRPSVIAFFSLGDVLLRVGFSLYSLHYTDRKNPFSEDCLHELKMNVFKEIVSYIQIEYTPEMLALIEEHKTS